MHRLAIAIAATAATAATAHAQCEDAIFLGTPSETTIPRIGALYVYDDTRPYGAPDVRATFTGRPGIVDVVDLDDRVSLIDYIGFDGGELDLRIGNGNERDIHAIYHLAAALPREPAPRVLQFWHDLVDCLDCYAHDAVMIQLDAPVAAVVARWTFDGVSTDRLVVPETSDDIPGAAVVELGESECRAHALDMAEMHAGGHLELTAIRGDGSRIAVRGLPDRIAEDRMPTDSVGVAHALHAAAADAPAPPSRAAALPADWNPMRGLDDAMSTVAAGIALLALGLLALMRLRPQLRAPNS